MGNSVEYEVRDQAAWITLNRPENRNALSVELTGELDRYLDQASREESARAIVLAGNGRHFCAGADLKNAGKGAVGSAGLHGTSPYTSILTQIMDGSKPVIARVQGGAFAGGLGLTVACDVVVAGESARFGFTEVRLGLAPWMLSVVLRRKGVLTRSAPYLLNGERFGAQEALAMNLVQRAVPDDGLDAAVEEELERFRQCAPHALAETKRIFRTVPTLPMGEAFAFAEKASAALFNGEEGQEGMAAFREKRKPRWAP
ncbi:MAG: enoyl-CoA hydratase-related protein [SAR324 cluster bacterium]|nr:enoyl-CoA hydratase-related protein [SAR324 cluster bacterium]